MIHFEQNNTQLEQIKIKLYEPTSIDQVLGNEEILSLEKFAIAAGFHDAKVGPGKMGVNDNFIRRSNIAWLGADILSKEILLQFERFIISMNNDHFKFELTGFEPLQYTVYNESNAGEYKWHIDTNDLGDNLIRKLSFSILLSDPSEYEGGKLLLNPNGNIMVAEEKKGRAIAFPSWVPHCVTPVTKGIRKALVIWAHGPMFK